MRISEAPVADLRGPLTAQRRRLLNLLTLLSDAQWAAPTAAPRWPVKDIALHLLDVDLSWLARGRDHDQAGIIPVSSDHEEFVCGLAQRNQRWVDGTRILSPRLITDLLRWSGKQLDAYLGTVDLAASSSVYWQARSRCGSTSPASSPSAGCITGRSRRRPGQPDPTTRPMSTCPWCCARSSGVSRTSTGLRHQVAPRSP